MDTLVGISIVSLVVPAVTLVAIFIKSVKKTESLPFVVYTGRNSRIMSRRLERETVLFLL